MWYIGFIIYTDKEEGSNTDTILVDHLHPVDKSLIKWRYPSKQDQCRVDLRQIIALKPVYDWDLGGRVPTLKLLNPKEIDSKVESTELLNM